MFKSVVHTASVCVHENEFCIKYWLNKISVIKWAEQDKWLCLEIMSTEIRCTCLVLGR